MKLRDHVTCGQGVLVATNIAAVEGGVEEKSVEVLYYKEYYDYL